MKAWLLILAVGCAHESQNVRRLKPLVPAFEAWSGVHLKPPIRLRILHPDEHAPSSRGFPCFFKDQQARVLLQALAQDKTEKASAALTSVESAFIAGDPVTLDARDPPEMTLFAKLWARFLDERLLKTMETSTGDGCWALAALQSGTEIVIAFAAHSELVEHVRARDRLRGVVDRIRTVGVNAAGRELANDAPAPVQRIETFEMIDAIRFVAAVYDDGGLEAVRKLLDKPPTATFQILHPDRFVAGEKPVAVATPDAPRGWSLRETGNLGELGIHVLFSICPGLFKHDEHPGDGWQGDAYSILENADHGPALLWVTTWATNSDATVFERHLKRWLTCWNVDAQDWAYRNDVRIYHRGQKVLVTRGFFGSLGDDVMTRIIDAP